MTPEALLGPADSLRAALLRPWGTALRPLLLSRARRVLWIAAFGVTLAFALACTAPLWVLALGPVLLGVPHVLADLRYLVVRPRLHRRWPLVLLAGAPLAIAAVDPRVEVGLFAAVGAVLAARASWQRKAGLVAALGVALALAWRHSFVAQLLLLHIHNLVALALWWAWRKRSRWAWLIPALAVAGTAAIFSGAAEPVLEWTHGWDAPATGSSFSDHLNDYAPLEEPLLALRLLLAFVFLQSVHYLVWLRLVPEDDRPRPVPRPFAASFRALRADFGLWPLVLVAIAALAIAAWGAVDLAAARDGYLRLAGFHGYLELAVGALWLAEGRA